MIVPGRCPAGRRRPALREVSITNTVVWSVTKTQSHHRWPSLSSMSSNTCQLVSSGVHVTGLAAVRGDRLRPRRDQRRDLAQRPAQRARRHVEPVGGQRLDDPVSARPARADQRRQRNPAVDQALRHGLARRRRAGRPGPRMRTPPPVAAPPPHDPGDLHLPVDLLAVLGAQELKRLPAFGTAPLAGIQIDEPFLGLQMRMIPPPV